MPSSDGLYHYYVAYAHSQGFGGGVVTNASPITTAADVQHVGTTFAAKAGDPVPITVLVWQLIAAPADSVKCADEEVPR